MKKLILIIAFIAYAIISNGQKITALPVVTSATDESLLLIRSGSSGDVISTITLENMISVGASDTAAMLLPYILESEVASDYVGVSDTATMLTDYITDAEAREAIHDSLSANTVDGDELYPLLADTIYSTLYGAGANQAADSTLFAKGAKEFGVWTVKVDTAYIVNIDNQRFSVGDSAIFNVYIGNSMTGVATDSLFSSPQAVGDNRVTFAPNTRKIPKDKDVWIGLLSDQITGMRPKLWNLQLNWYIITAN